MLLDQQENKPKRQLQVEGNNQLIRGTVFAAINLFWFFFLFAFINIDWKYFSPFAPWIYGLNHPHVYSFYFICFSFFISTLIFSLVFYRNSLHPNELLFRFVMILFSFTVLFILWSMSKNLLIGQRNLAMGGMVYLFKEDIVMGLVQGFTRFVLYYFLFYLLIMPFSKLFFNGNFGTAGFILCGFITLLFLLSIYLLADLELRLSKTKFIAEDLGFIAFFTLLGFGTGIASGREPNKKSIKRGLKGL